MGFEASDKEQRAGEEAAGKVALVGCSCSKHDARMDSKPNNLPLFLTRGLGTRIIGFSDDDYNRSELDWDDTIRETIEKGLPFYGNTAVILLAHAMSKILLRCQSLNLDPIKTGSGRLSIVNVIY